MALAGLGTGLLILVTLLWAVGVYGDDLTEPFNIDNEVGMGTYAWQMLVMVVGILVVGRVLFWILVGLSEVVFPAEYKAEMHRFYEEATERLGYPP